MITRKEMGYVNSKPSKTPYPGEEYCEEIFNKLEKCFELYNTQYLNRKYTIQFSNNEEVDFAILDKNLAHILGVDYKNLSSEYLENYRKSILDLDTGGFSSYMLLERIIEKKDSILEHDYDNSSCFALNYYRVGIKCDIFSKLADLSKFHYGCINFNKDIYTDLNPEISFSPQSTKFLYTPSDEVVSPYFMMGIKKDNYSETNEYIVETLMAVDNPSRFFNGQEIIIPTQILTDDNGILYKNKATAAEKIKLIREYQNIVNEYKINNKLNIYGDYFSLLMSNKSDEESKLQLKK